MLVVGPKHGDIYLGNKDFFEKYSTQVTKLYYI